MSVRVSRHARVFGLAISLAAALVLFTYRLAVAHAALISSDPRAGSWVPASPPRIRLVFSEPIEASLATVSLVSTSGAAIELPTASDVHDVHALLATLSPLGAGQYRVVWRVVSADGHPVGGSFVFGVGAPVSAASVPDLTQAPEMKVWGPALFGAPLVPAVLRGAGVGSLLAVTGLLWFWISTKSRETRATVDRTALGLAVCTAVLVPAHLFAWLANTAPDHSVNMAWVSASFATTPGRVELALSVLAVVPLWALGLARRPVIGFAGGFLAILVTAAIGHSAAIVPEWAIPFKAVHLIALSVWSGGLVWILAGAARRDSSEDFHEISRVSSAALWAVIAVAFSGVVQTRVLMSSWSDLVSVYGAVVLAKSVGLLALVGFGAYHRGLIAKFGAEIGAVAFLRKSVSREIVLFSATLLLAGFLAYLSPPMERRTDASPTSSSR